MAISKTSTYADAANVLKGLIDHDKTAEGAKPAAEALSEALGQVSRLLSIALHRAAKTAVASPGTGTTLNTFRTGAFATAKGSAAVIGDLWVNTVATDLSGTVCATAKGSALAAGDVFRWTNVTTSPVIEYVGNLYRSGFGVNPSFA